MGRELEEGKGEYIHLIVSPLHLIHEIQTTVHDERVHMPGFLAETGNTIAALFRCSEFELEEGLVVGVYYAKVI